MSLFVGNLSPHVQYRELERTFRRFGRCNLDLKDGFAFVIYESYRDAERALRALQGRSIYRERPSISWARTQRPFQRFPAQNAPPFRRNFQNRDIDRVEHRPRRRASPDMDKALDDPHRKEPLQPAYDFEAKELRDGSRDAQPREEDADGNVAVRPDEWKDQNAADFVPPEHELRDSDPLDGGRWGEIPSDGSLDRCLIEDEEEYHEDPGDRENEGVEGSEKDGRLKLPVFPGREKSLERSPHPHDTEERIRRERDLISKPIERCYYCGRLGHVKRNCRSRPNPSLFNRGGLRRDGFDARRQSYRGIRGANGFRRPMGRFRAFDGPRGFHREIDPGYRRRTLGMQSGQRTHEQGDHHSRARSRRKRHQSKSQSKSESSSHSRKRRRKHRKKYRKRSTSRERRKRQHSSSSSKSESRSHSKSSSSSLSPSHSHSTASHSRSSKSYSRSLGSRSRSSRRSMSASSRSRSVSSSSRSVSRSKMSVSSHSRSRSHSVSSKSVTRSASQSRGHQQMSSQSLKSHRLQSRSSTPLKSDSNGLQGNSLEHRIRSSKSCSETGDMVGGPILMAVLANEDVGLSSKTSQHYDEKYISPGSESGEGLTQEKHQSGTDGGKGGNRGIDTKDAGDLGGSWRVQKDEVFEKKNVGSGRNTDSLEAPASLSQLGSASQNSELEVFGAARLWPWKAILQRRLKRGPITIPNYERRKTQNKEFHIVDKFVRSSSGWWERPE